MPTHVYADLAPIGWVELTEDSLVSKDLENPLQWALDGGHLDSVALDKIPNNLDAFPFVNVAYKGKEYRVSPLHLQIVRSED